MTVLERDQSRQCAQSGVDAVDRGQPRKADALVCENRSTEGDLVSKWSNVAGKEHCGRVWEVLGRGFSYRAAAVPWVQPRQAVVDGKANPHPVVVFGGSTLGRCRHRVDPQS